MIKTRIFSITKTKNNKPKKLKRVNKKRQKLRNYLEGYLGKTDVEIIEKFGNNIKMYSEDTLIVIKPYNFIFRDEVTFFLREGKVVDIVITEFFLWIGIRNIFYYKGESPEYKVVELYKKRFKINAFRTC